MDASKRRKYLRAMGVDVWVSRNGEPAEPATAARVQVPVAVQGSEAPEAPEAGSAAAQPGVRESRPARLPTTPEPAPGISTTTVKVQTPTPAHAVPGDWGGLRAMVQDCMRCKLCTTRTRTVFGVGPESAPLMVVGEGPGADEDAQGEPFVGRAGKLLDEMLTSIGRSRRDNVFIANVVKCRPPGNRDPESDEVEACRPYLDQQIRLIRPRLIVGLGRIAAQRLLATDQPLSKLRGPLHRYGADGIPLFITYHPAYLLRSPREKAKSWDDLKKVWRFLRDSDTAPA